MQHQQAYMHTEQETIANALQHAMAMLQILTKEKQTPTRNNDSTGIVQSECRLPSAFTQNNRQGAESTETNGIMEGENMRVRIQLDTEVR